VEDLEKIKSDLGARIAKCNRIIFGLESNDAFREMLLDFKDQMKRLDDGWQWITDEKHLKEAQITKMAFLSVVNVLDNYKQDEEQAQKQLLELNNPDSITGKDFDNEGAKNE
jgi:hypothetical protein